MGLAVPSGGGDGGCVMLQLGSGGGSGRCLAGRAGWVRPRLGRGAGRVCLPLAGAYGCGACEEPEEDAAEREGSLGRWAGKVLRLADWQARCLPGSYVMTGLAGYGGR